MEMNTTAQPLTTRRLSTPRTAAVAGILFELALLRRMLENRIG